MLILGLTGSIGAGKSFTAQCFREAGVPVFDADATVHTLLAPGGEAVIPITELFPDVKDKQGGINRAQLGGIVFFDEAKLRQLEAILHPLVKQAGEQFLQAAMAAGSTAIVQDIPLLFETGAEKDCHAVIVVSAPEHIRRARALQREGMHPEKLDAVHTLQWPDEEKIARAHFVIDGTASKEEIAGKVHEILVQVASPGGK